MHKVLLLVLGLLFSLGIAKTAAQQEPQATQYQSKWLKDTRKLDAGFWIKVASKHTRTAGQEAACLKDYGQQYLARWRRLQGAYCNATTAGGSAHQASVGSSSHVQCYAHPEADLSTCLAQNLVLTSTNTFLGSTRHSSELPQPQPGCIQLSCNRALNPAVFLRGRLQSNEGSRAWLITAPSFDPSNSQTQAACSDSNAVTHPVLFLLRVDPQNAFHNLETVVSVFAALAVLQLEPQHVQHGMEIVIADDRQAGYFAAIWRRLAWPHPLRVLRQQPYPDNTCFTHAVIAPYAAHAQSLLTYKAGSVDEVMCESVVLQAASRWLRHLFRDLLPPSHRRAAAAGGRHAKPLNTAAHTPDADVAGDGSSDSSRGPQQGPMFLAGNVFRDLAPLEPGPTQSAAPLQLLYVVWLSRRRYEQQHNATLTDWQKARVLSAQQQEELVLALQRAVLQWNEQTCQAAGQSGCHARHVMFSLQVAELSDMSFYPDQLSLMLRAGVLAGVHGAGLANQIYMRPRAGAVVEVWYGMDSNTHYHNMAHMLGHTYFNVKCEEERLDVGAVAAKVTAAMDAAAAKHAAALSATTQAKRAWWWRRKHPDDKPV